MWLLLGIAGVLAVVVYYQLRASSQPQTQPPLQSRELLNGSLDGTEKTDAAVTPRAPDLAAAVAPVPEPQAAGSLPSEQQAPPMDQYGQEGSGRTALESVLDQEPEPEPESVPQTPLDAQIAEREARVEEWFQRGMDAARRYHLTKPEADSALSFASRISAHEPGRPEEAQLMAAIKTAYLTLLEGALLRGDSELVSRYRELASAMGASPEEIDAVYLAGSASDPDYRN